MFTGFGQRLEINPGSWLEVPLHNRYAQWINFNLQWQVNMKDILQKIRRALEKDQLSDPRQIQFSVVSVILTKLNWNLWSPVEVNVAFDAPTVTLTLPNQPAPVMQIEILTPGSINKTTRPQNAQVTTPFYALTDGKLWRFFYFEKGKNQPDFCYKTLDMLRSAPDDMSIFFKRYLGKGPLNSGETQARLEKQLDLAKQKRWEPLKRALPKAKQISSKPPNPPIGDVLRAIMRRAGIQMDDADVNNFVAQVVQPDAENSADAGASEATIKTKEWIEPVTGMIFIWVEGGSFMMGSPDDEQGRQRDEGPVHNVTVDGYWLAKYPVTQAQWRKVMEESEKKPWQQANEGEDNERRKLVLEKTARYPMENALWDDTQEFIRKLGLLGGKESTIRLPTEAEWEYAARAGTTTAYPFEKKYMKDHVWFNSNSAGELQEVGTKQANPWGFHDMLGNVWEWVQDSFTLYSAGVQTNPLGTSARGEYIRRGGSCRSSARVCRSARRNSVKVDELEAKNTGGLGVRFARSADGSPGPTASDE
ncbi:MAG: formylglycine-generating enzyme family protein [Magnetococcales bacterium]|nr:formylglycine-generating enzyme family protein [Magnetococcales bacterium]